jgi:hypothetical protein
MISDRVSRLRLPFAVAVVALAAFAAHVVGQRMSARAARAEGEDALRRGDVVRAAERFHAALEIDPASTAVRSRLAAAYAGISAASLAQASGAVLDAEARAGLLPEALALRASAPDAAARPIANDDLRRTLAERWSAAIAEGIDTASKAIALDREHEPAMLALEAWHQLAADLAASPDEYRRHMTSADEWRRKALEARRLEAERRSP